MLRITISLISWPLVLRDKIFKNKKILLTSHPINHANIYSL